jgi:hypothetical protein
LGLAGLLGSYLGVLRWGVIYELVKTYGLNGRRGPLNFKVILTIIIMVIRRINAKSVRVGIVEIIYKVFILYEEIILIETVKCKEIFKI